ncbi:MAG: hypothetical protein NTY19_13790 [Planctomycetota bacterium]|nr:hypothetical protein [Planctomycetota bacterium]
MSLRFRYQLSPTGRLIIPLGGRTVRPRPLIAVTIVGPRGSRVREAILDTAADDTVFPESLANVIGVDLTDAPTGVGSGVGLVSVPLRYAEVSLRIATTQELREWSAWVGFTSGSLRRPILGFARFLQFFAATFLGDREEVELSVNRLYPGT